jgi:hypothetical protein
MLRMMLATRIAALAVVDTGTTASWSEQGGFTLFPPAGGWGHGKQVPFQALWGDLHVLSFEEYRYLTLLDVASGRTIVSAACRCQLPGDNHKKSCKRKHYLLLGKNAFVNCLCWEHANLVPHKEPHFNLCRPYYTTLDPGDWVACSTANNQNRIPGTEELGINYGDTFKLPCPRCACTTPPHCEMEGGVGLGSPLSPG